jgi:hypothetical protein
MKKSAVRRENSRSGDNVAEGKERSSAKLLNVFKRPLWRIQIDLTDPIQSAFLRQYSHQF